RLDVNDIPFSPTDLAADSGSEVIVAVRRAGAHTPDLNALDTLLRGQRPTVIRCQDCNRRVAPSESAGDLMHVKLDAARERQVPRGPHQHGPRKCMARGHRSIV